MQIRKFKITFESTNEEYGEESTVFSRALAVKKEDEESGGNIGLGQIGIAMADGLMACMDRLVLVELATAILTARRAAAVGEIANTPELAALLDAADSFVDAAEFNNYGCGGPEGVAKGYGR